MVARLVSDEISERVAGYGEPRDDETHRSQVQQREPGRLVRCVAVLHHLLDGGGRRIPSSVGTRAYVPTFAPKRTSRLSSHCFKCSPRNTLMLLLGEVEGEEESPDWTGRTSPSFARACPQARSRIIS